MPSGDLIEIAFSHEASKTPRPYAAQHHNPNVSTPTPSKLYLPLSVQLPSLPGLEIVSRGKVRILYKLPGHENLLLVVTTDQVSVFDEVMPWLVPNKGHSLNLLSIWWKKQMDTRLKDVPHDLVAWGRGIDSYLPKPLRGNRDLQMRATVVMKLDMIDAEMVFRRRLTGSAWKAYDKNGKRIFSGNEPLPDGLKEWHDFGYSFFNPTTKAVTGHDVEMLVSGFRETYGPVPQIACAKVFQFCYDTAAARGICYVDGKFEGGRDPERQFRLGDEAPTPDSSRFVLFEDLEKAQRECTTPPSLDKQPMRNHCANKLGLSTKTKFDAALRRQIEEAAVPTEVIAQMSENYPKLFKMFSGNDLQSFFEAHAGTEN